MRHRPLPSTVSRTLDLFQTTDKIPTRRRDSQTAPPGRRRRASSAAPVNSRNAMLEHTIHVLKGARRTEVDGMDSAQVASCFQAFDALIPELGLHSRTLKLLRDEIYDAVHSDEYTANRSGEVSRIPYFTLLAGLHKTRNRDVERALAAERHAQEQLGRARAELDAVKAENELLATERAANSEQLDALSAELNDLNGNIAEKVKQGSAALADEAARTRCELDELRAHMKEREDYFAEAGKYMEGYKKLQKAFETPFKSSGAAERKTDVSHKTMLKRAHVEATKLRSQLLVARNTAVSELDEALSDPVLTRELPLYKSRFTGSMKEAAKELQLNLDHTSAMAAEMSRLSNRDQKQFEIDGKFRTQDMVVDRYSLLLTVSRDDTRSFQPLGANPMCTFCTARQTFCPHNIPDADCIIALPPSTTHLRFQRPVARFSDLQDLPTPVIVELPDPDDATAIAAVDGAVGGSKKKAHKGKGKKGSKGRKGSAGKKKPKSAKGSKKKGKKGSGGKKSGGGDGDGDGGDDADGESRPTSPASSSLHPESATSGAGGDEKNKDADAPATSLAVGEDQQNQKRSKAIGKLPAAKPPNPDGSQSCRLQIARDPVHRTSRVVDVPSMRSLLTGFYRTLPPCDPDDADDDGGAAAVDGDGAAAAIPSAQEAFINYLERRYLYPEVATAVANDVVEAIEGSPDSPDMMVLGQVLHGTLPLVAPRHYSAIVDILESIPWTENTTVAVENVLEELYSFLSEDELEEMLLNFVSHCQSKVSRPALMEYILLLIAEHREPWMANGSKLAEAHLTMDAGVMSYDDMSAFIKTSACIDGYGEQPIHFNDVDSMQELFDWSEAQAKFIGGGAAGQVPSSKCGAITGFMALRSSKEEIVQAITDRFNGLSEWKRLQAKRERREKRELLRNGGGNADEKESGKDGGEGSTSSSRKGSGGGGSAGEEDNSEDGGGGSSGKEVPSPTEN